jgi:hypothetical protein
MDGLIFNDLINKLMKRPTLAGENIILALTGFIQYVQIRTGYQKWEERADNAAIAYNLYQDGENVYHYRFLSKAYQSFCLCLLELDGILTVLSDFFPTNIPMIKVTHPAVIDGINGFRNYGFEKDKIFLDQSGLWEDFSHYTNREYRIRAGLLEEQEAKELQNEAQFYAKALRR